MAVDPKDREAYEIGKSTNDMDPVSRFIRDRAWDWQPESEKAAYDKGRSGEQLDEDKSTDDSSSSGCFLTTACVQAIGLPDNCVELETLRGFRDRHMLASEDGRAEVEEYYAKAPAIVRHILSKQDAASVFQRIYLELVTPTVALIQGGHPEAARELYRRWVLMLAGDGSL